jgi:hypothetical protein
MNRYLLTAIILLLTSRLSIVYCQLPVVAPTACQPPKNRELFHDQIDKQQRFILEMDKVKDDKLTVSDNDQINNAFTGILVNGVDSFQCAVENDTTLVPQEKIRHLRGMESLLKAYSAKAADKTYRLTLYNIITAFEKCVEINRRDESIAPVVNQLSYAEADILVRSTAVIFEKNPGYQNSLDLVILKYCLLYPGQTFQTLKENPKLPFADSLIRTVSREYTRQLYDYAQADNALGILIRNIQDDKLISTVVQMARKKDGQQYFPFLDNIVNGRMSLAGVDSVKNDSVLYYRLLVQTQIDYTLRAQKKDTAIEFSALTQRMERKAREGFVDLINGLHNENESVRFRCIQPLTAEELYYLAVSSDGTIYTSSFVKGVYPLMMKKINNRGDSLLLSVHFDKYRKLIKMAAGYNTLGDFLSSFPEKKNAKEESDAEKLMRVFVDKLENGNGLEDGVDVADSYASIVTTNQSVAAEMLKNVQRNYKRNLASNNKRGIAIYKILKDIFLSADSTSKIDLTKELGIPPIYELPYQSLVDDSGRVVIQVFFYSDIKVQGIFNGFINIFKNNNWRISGNDQWVTISSIKGKPVFIYANKAPIEENSEDENNQEALNDYLQKNNLHPRITIHRGHSYTAPYTIQQMSPTSRIIFLGSCGGYQIIHDALEKNPDAHIIATKQIADASVNRPFFQLLTDKVRAGKDINWIPFWKELDQMVTDKIFEDYMPPYKNLGAIFIKAYKIAMEKTEREDRKTERPED